MTVTFSTLVTGLIVVVVVKTGCVTAETPDGEMPTLGTPNEVVEEDETPVDEIPEDAILEEDIPTVEFAAGAKVQEEVRGADPPPHKDPACAAVEKLSPKITAVLCNKYFISITIVLNSKITKSFQLFGKALSTQYTSEVNFNKI